MRGGRKLPVIPFLRFCVSAVIPRRAVLAMLLVAACGSTPEPPPNPIRLTIVNRHEENVTGALLRFDRELLRVDRVSTMGFREIQLRLAPADTVRVEGEPLVTGGRSSYRIEGRDGSPRLLEARWLLDGRLGPVIDPGEIRIEPAR
jgi:hypothetical protein